MNISVEGVEYIISPNGQLLTKEVFSKFPDRINSTTKLFCSQCGGFGPFSSNHCFDNGSWLMTCAYKNCKRNTSSLVTVVSKIQNGKI